MAERASTALAGKVAVVSGAGRGIGLGCATALARAGAAVVLNDRPESRELPDALAQLAAEGHRVHGAAADVFERSGCEAVVAEAVRWGGSLDILVSNPAVGHRGEFLDYLPADFERVVHGTLVAGFHLSQLAAREMVRQGRGGKIVFISSVQGEVPYARCVAYNAAKAGLNHLAQTIAVELFRHRINVNVIAPGWIDTPQERQTFGLERMQAAAPELPWGRLGTPDDIGQAAAFLASSAADYITGTVLRVDGGYVWKDAR